MIFDAWQDDILDKEPDGDSDNLIDNFIAWLIAMVGG
jgi:hypothetical protein